ncbi:exonuclease SbcC [Enterococcus sp. PF1-24]|uniref:SbcC/MukB-like Walker B domain-containing protein n=1 Tax=unclassified Enterococcus TaxID=2608891 RepID=UPI0024766CC2|nr:MULTISPECIES: SMC family ATPase [unclassified Enterococcus]MDH6363850.1 exonuclease SbcC [Enterococcus sp. PFB1-1]MDH6400964.1 exonuclease SbcC [Enterococcus sp. PF1-24]
MRPLRLKLKNFGSFIDEEIDFSQLSSATLFLISGKTGTGKTTIFDGMTYALFGETSGKLRTGKEMRSAFAQPTEETYVTFTFEHQDLVYQVMRMPEQIVMKKRGAGERSQAAKVSLTVMDLAGKELRQYNKNGEVAQQILELVHLTAEQFTQIVLLPQGKFRTFLSAKSDEREVVLRQLFGTQMFRDFAEKLKERVKEASKEWTASEEKLKLLQENFASEVALSELPNQEFIAEAHAAITLQQEKIAVAKTMLAELQVQEQQAEKAFYQAQEISKLFAQQADLLNQQQQLLAKEPEIKQQEQRLQQLEWALEQKPLVDKLAEAQTEAAKLTAKQQTLQTEINENQQAQLDWQSKNQLFQEKLPSYQNCQSQLQTVQQQLPLAEKLAADQKQLTEVTAAIAKTAAEIAENKQAQDTLAQQQLAITEIVVGGETLQQTTNFLALFQEKLKQLTKRKQEQEKLQGQAEQNKRASATTAEKLTAVEASVATKTIAYTAVKNDWLKMQIARLSLELTDDEPCPVCGALEHPQPFAKEADYSSESIRQQEASLALLEEELEKLKQEQTTLQAESQHLLAEEQNLVQQILVAEAEAENLLAELTTLLVANSQSPIATLAEGEHLLLQLRSEITLQEQELADAKNQLQTVQQQQRVLVEEQKSADLAQHELKQQQASLAGGISSLQAQGVSASYQELAELQQQLTLEISVYQKEESLLAEESTQLKQQEIRLEEQLTYNLQALKTAESTSEQQHQLLQQELATAEMAGNLTVLQAWLQDTAEISSMRQEIQAYQLQKNLNQQQLQTLAEQLTQKAPPQLTEFETALALSREKVQNQQAEIYQLASQLTQNQETLANFTQLYQKNQQKLDEFKQLSELSQVMNGDNAMKTSLERYILQSYLQEVLQIANQRLGLLTRNRYQFELSTAIGSRRNVTGLEINIYDDDAGNSRSANTLSGGESFIAALALALSLAEVIQNQSGGISIEALFIDEGFGSLDEESLNMAMEALETIESDGRMIGIISHVGELKERIPQQILVTGNGSGQSEITYQL